MLNSCKIALFYILLLSPFFAEAQTNSLQNILYWFNERLWTGWIVFFSVLAGFLAFLGIVEFMASAGNEEKKTEGRKVIIWAIITFFVMFSFWGIITILQYALFGSIPPVNIPQ